MRENGVSYMKNHIRYILALCLLMTALLAMTTTAAADESGGSPGTLDPPDPTAERWSITKIEKPYPCFVNGTIRKEDLLGRLPLNVTVTVEKPVGQFQTKSASVEWNTKNIPSMIDVGKAFTINGTVVDSALEAEGITGGNHSVSILVITAPSGAISTLRGKARIVTDLETEVELYLICPETATGFYIEYSTDQQEWKAFRNGANLWPELTDPDTNKIRPGDIKNNGEITMTYRLEILRSKAAAGFWVRVRLEGSEHEGTSNVCHFKPADKSGVSTWKPGMDSGSGSGDSAGMGGQSFGGQDTGGGTEMGEGGEESESGDGEETKPSEEETKRKRRSSGNTPSEEPTEEPTEPTKPSDDGSEKRNSSGGYAAGGSYYGGYMSWGDEDEEEPKKDSWALKLGAAAAIIGGISLAGYLVYRRFTKED